jgi:hypothetical protein
MSFFNKNKVKKYYLDIFLPNNEYLDKHVLNKLGCYDLTLKQAYERLSELEKDIKNDNILIIVYKNGLKDLINLGSIYKCKIKEE